ncbi:MAG TPA: putative LPS assembly protein LptD [Longimicrobium sp.]|nr:putative LPS assembly protein LptD [Longimicrobium sp.]
MNRIPRIALVLLALLLAAGALHAQPNRPPRRNLPLPGDTARRPAPAQGDTAAADTAREVVQDSIIDRLLELPGYIPIEYQGDSAEYNAGERTLRLRGRPLVTRLETRLQAEDSIVYREARDFVEVYGKPQATGEGQDIQGDVMFYDLAAERATVRGARTTVAQGGTWHVRGNVTSEQEGERIYATGGTFTSDDRQEPAYFFKVDRFKVLRDRILVGRPAYLYFRNVPVFALPFIVQDLAKGRRSGFLIPQVEINDIVRTQSRGGGSRGTGRQISNLGYYWAINQYMGAQVALEWRSQSWLALRAGYDFNWRRRFLNGGFTMERFYRDEGGNQLNLQGRASWQPDERTQLSASVNYASSSQFERNRSLDPFRQTSDISSTLSASRKMDWGQLSAQTERRQSITNDDVQLRQRFSISPQTITLFPTPQGGAPRWYNEGSLTLGLDVSGSWDTPGLGLERRLASKQNTDANVTSSVRFGAVGVGGGVGYNRTFIATLPAIDSSLAEPDISPDRLALQPGAMREELRWNAGTGYEFRLFAGTRLTPNVSVGQSLVRRDSTLLDEPAPGDPRAESFGRWVPGPMRVNFGAGLNTEVFGFFPGFGDYSAIRHHVRPGVSYTYSPTARQDSVQTLVHGRVGGRERNEITLSLDQTFEAKLRPRSQGADTRGAEERAGSGNPGDGSAITPNAQPDSLGAAAPADTAAGDSAGGRAGQPEQAQKITLLAINTSALAYSFVPTDTFGTRFQTQDITNTIRSDLLGGFNVVVSHSLFERERLSGATGGLFGGDRRGRFRPYLTGVQTSLSFGQNSAFFRWLGFARPSDNERHSERGRTPAEEGAPTADPPGSQTQTNRPQGTGGGPWNVQLTYSLRRERPALTDVPTAIDRGNQQMSGRITFYPTRHWAVNWYTDYSVSEGRFGTHVLNFKRDLYRWEANFDFVRAPNGNTSFSFRVHLTDLPDLKADYSEQNLGTDRTGTGTARPRTR